MILSGSAESLSLIGSLCQCPCKAVSPSPTCQNHIKERINKSWAFEILVFVFDFYFRPWQGLPASGFYLVWMNMSEENMMWNSKTMQPYPSILTGKYLWRLQCASEYSHAILGCLSWNFWGKRSSCRTSFSVLWRTLRIDSIIDSIKGIRALRGLIIQTEARVKLFAQYTSGRCGHAFLVTPAVLEIWTLGISSYSTQFFSTGAHIRIT